MLPAPFFRNSTLYPLSPLSRNVVPLGPYHLLAPHYCKCNVRDLPGPHLASDFRSKVLDAIRGGSLG
jgi:hypothetical protein